MSILAAIFGFVRTILRRRATLALENLALRQQLAVLRRSVKRPRFRPRDRAFWVLLRPPDDRLLHHGRAGQGVPRRREVVAIGGHGAGVPPFVEPPAAPLRIDPRHTDAVQYDASAARTPRGRSGDPTNDRNQ